VGDAHIPFLRYFGLENRASIGKMIRIEFWLPKGYKVLNDKVLNDKVLNDRSLTGLAIRFP